MYLYNTNIMKRSNYFYTLLILILFCSCGENKENYEFPNDGFKTENNNSNQDVNSIQNKQKTHALKPYYVMNKQFGIPIGAMPIPSTWKRKEQNSENIYFEGPNGIEVYGEVSNSFFYSNSPERNQYTLTTGRQVKPVKSTQRVIEEDLRPLLEAEGLQFINQFPLPQLAQFDNKFNSYIFKSTPEQRHNDCIVTEWEGPDGKLTMVIVRYFIAQYTSIGGLDWGY